VLKRCDRGTDRLLPATAGQEGKPHALMPIEHPLGSQPENLGRPIVARQQTVERDLQVRVITSLELASQNRKLVQALGAEMLTQTTRHLRLLDRSKLERDPQELVQRPPERAGRERAGFLFRHGPSVLAPAAYVASRAHP
jgi:hypothetical protein